MKYIFGMIIALCFAVPADAQSYYFYRYRGNCNTPVVIPVPVPMPYYPRQERERYQEPDHYGTAMQQYFHRQYGGTMQPRVTYNPNYVEPAYVEPQVIENPFFKKEAN